METISTDSCSIFPLLKLPAELRLMIYRAYILRVEPFTSTQRVMRWRFFDIYDDSGTIQETIRYFSECSPPFIRPELKRYDLEEPPRNVLALLLTCHQVYDEVLPEMYKRIRFIITVRQARTRFTRLSEAWGSTGAMAKLRGLRILI
jgi:hypothetical protein